VNLLLGKRLQELSTCCIKVFLSSVFLVENLKYIEDKKVPTCGVDARGNFYYNPKFLDDLTNRDELLGVLAHEVMHLVLKHPSRQKHRNIIVMSPTGIVSLYNIASDICINNILVANKLELPKLCLIPANNSIEVFGTTIKDIDKKSAEEIYDELKTFLKSKVRSDSSGGCPHHEDESKKGNNKDKDENEDDSKKEKEDSNGDSKEKEDSNGDGKEKEDSNGDGKEKEKESQCDTCSKKGNCSAGNGVTIIDVDDAIEEFDKHMWGDKDGKGKDGKGKDSKGKDGKQNEGGVQDWGELLPEAAVYAKHRGVEPAGMEREIGVVNTKKLNLDAFLRREVARYIPSDLSWGRPNRRFISQGIYLPATIGEEVKVLFSIDTSGSVSQEDLNRYLSIIIGVSSSYSSVEFRIISHDAAVHDDYHIFNGNIHKIKRLKIHGGGGTDHVPLFDYIRDKKYTRNMKVLFSFTDGYSNFPDKKPKDLNTVFILSGYHCGKANMPKWSNVIISE